MIDLAIDSRVFLTTALDAALQELDIIFNTVNTELITRPDYGSDFEQFFWQLNPVTDNLETYIKEKINQAGYFLPMMDTSVEVTPLEGDYRFIYDVKITVSDGNKSGVRTYRLS